MKARLKTAVRCMLFVIITTACVWALNRLLTPKFYYNQVWPVTNTYEEFYQLEKDSVDVLFLGSSHVESSMNPQVIYDEYGIRSYNLGSPEQSLLVTYYWLKEALKYQSPKVVVIDTYTFHKYTDAYVYNKLNSNEASVHSAMDCMRLSPLKIEAAKAIEKLDPTQSGLGYIFTNIRYHDRWKDLGEDDYTMHEMVEHGSVKGYAAVGGTTGGTKDPTFRAEEAASVEPEPMVDIADEYLGKILDLCEENDIEPVFVMIPCAEKAKRYKATKEYADAHGVPFYDFNEATLYNAVGYDREKDSLWHPNYHGAEKLSLYMGKVLKDRYDLQPVTDESFDKSREAYLKRVRNIELTETGEIHEYLKMLEDPRYDVFVMIPSTTCAYIDAEFAEEWKRLGFSTDLRKVKDGEHYCALRSDEVIEKQTKKDIAFSGAIRDGKVPYSFVIDTSIMLKASHTYSMVVDGTECGNQEPGIRLVVYDNDTKMIVDKVSIDTTVPELTMTRY